MLRIPLRRVGSREERGEALPLPSYATEGSAGLDLRADQAVHLEAGQRALVPTGIAIELPPGYEAQVRPRSGLALRYGLTLLNAPGTIDSDYRGELGVILINLGQEAISLERGARIAQLVVARVEKVRLDEVASLEESGRGEGGFGHSGER